MISQEEAKHFREAVEKANSVFITAHVGPDGDTLGSMLGLMHAFLESFDHHKRVDCVISGRMPDVYKFMPGIDEVIDIEEEEHRLLENYDLAISVDCGAADRLGAAQSFFKEARMSINIDHHVSNDAYGQLNIIDPKAAATGEVVADLLKANDVPISPETATCLFVAVLTDTGGFKYSNTTAKVFELMALLTRSGADPETIYRHIYEERPKVKTMLQAHLVRKAQFNVDETLSWVVIPRSVLEEHGALDEHLDGLVEVLRQIDSVLVSAIIRETRTGMTKISLRSDSHQIDVSQVAQIWQGGGHKMAAGATLNMLPGEAEKQLIPHLEEAIRKIKPAPTAG